MRLLLMIFVIVVIMPLGVFGAITCMVSFGDSITVEEIDDMNTGYRALRESTGELPMVPGAIPGSWISVFGDDQSPWLVLGDPPRFTASLENYPAIESLMRRAAGSVIAHATSSENGLRYLAPDDLQIEIIVDNLIVESGYPIGEINTSARDEIFNWTLHTMIHNRLSVMVLENTSSVHPSGEVFLAEVRDGIREFNDFVYITREILEGDRHRAPE